MSRNFSMIAVTLLMSACADVDRVTMSIGEPEFISEFPEDLSLTENTSFECDEIGLMSIRIVDSLMVISHQGCWSILSTDGKHKYGNCVSRGEGPNEFIWTPYIMSSSFVKENGKVVAYISDTERGEVKRFNITDFVTTGNEEMTVSQKSDVMGNSTWDAIPVNADKTLIFQPNDDFTGFHHYVLTGDSVHTLQATTALDEMKVKSEATINMLAKLACASADGRRCAEVMIHLNQINLYSLDGDWGKTICVGEKLSDVKEIEEQWNVDRIDQYANVTSWPCGFGAIYSGVSELKKSMGVDNNSELQFFTWDGEPICKARLPISAAGFDIDFENNTLIAIDSNEDRLRAYDATELIKLLK